MNLLSVDWDYFFPNPFRSKDGKNDSKLLLYDWGHRETSFFISGLWHSRALGFAQNGLELPMTEGYSGFWERFRLRKGTKLFVAESHSQIVSLPFRRLVRGQLEQVYSFDAHHDAGYHRESPEEIFRRGTVTCEDWVLWFLFGGVETKVFYPPWMDTELEPEPAIDLDRKTDPGGKIPLLFSAVFLCRSGAWVPSWTDHQFQEFVQAFPGKVVDLGLAERSFDPAQVQQDLESFRKLREQHSYGKEC